MNQQHEGRDFLGGVIEGFYGRPWNQEQRLELLHQMRGWGLNTYFYSPKDDLRHRAIWREFYTEGELKYLRDFIGACSSRDIHFFYGLAPGLDVRYSDPEECSRIREKLMQLWDAGCRHFALLFDDIPDHIADSDREKFGSFARAQCEVANSLFQEFQEKDSGTRFLFCPTPYCQRMADKGLGGPNYLADVGEGLSPGIDVFWTGPEIISREIAVDPVLELQQLLRRKPVLWDNLHANDYDLRRLFIGPYAGRPLELREATAGILINPNCEFEANYPALRTLSCYLGAGQTWSPRDAWLETIAEWLPRFKTVGRDEISLDDLTFLGDCFYLPHENGETAIELLEDAKMIATRPVGEWGNSAGRFSERVRQVVELARKMTELKNRELFHTFNRQLWQLREELELLEQFLRWKQDGGGTGGRPFFSGHYLPGTYKGGILDDLRSMLAFQPNGGLTPSSQ